MKEVRYEKGLCTILHELYLKIEDRKFEKEIRKKKKVMYLFINVAFRCRIDHSSIGTLFKTGYLFKCLKFLEKATGSCKEKFERIKIDRNRGEK